MYAKLILFVSASSVIPSENSELSREEPSICFLNFVVWFIRRSRNLYNLSICSSDNLFPMETISMTKGTGIVTSVPSDSPDDYINLMAFKNDEKLRAKWGITPEMIFDPVHIITLEGFSGLAAKDVVEKLQIKSPKEKDKLQKAKEEVYTQGFYKGIIDIGPYKGQPVKDVKDKVKGDLIQNG